MGPTYDQTSGVIPAKQALPCVTEVEIAMSSPVERV